MPTGYEYRECKNWRGIPKPRRCPFCQQAKGEMRKARGGFQGVCPNCGATGPKRESHEEALRAWNGKDGNFLASATALSTAAVKALQLPKSKTRITTIRPASSIGSTQSNTSATATQNTIRQNIVSFCL